MAGTNTAQNTADDKGNLKNKPSSGQVNLNEATLDQIKAIPQMGEKRAQTIFNWRETHGNYASIDDLAKVPGIGRAFVEMVRMYAHV